METKQLPRWVPYVGYPLFFIFMFVICLHLTLPYGTIQSRITDEARKQGYQVTMTSLGPALGFGVKAKGLMVTPAPPAGAAADAQPASALLLDTVTVRPSLLPLGASFSASAFGGDLSGAVSNKGKTSQALEVHGKNLELARAGLKPLVGLDLEGRMSLDADVTTSLADLTKTAGTVKLSGKDMVVLGGTVNYVDLPRASLGAVDVKLKAEGGKAAFDTFAITGGDLEAKGDGEIDLGQRLATSTIKVKLDFKPQEEWLKKYSFIQTGLSMAGHPGSGGFYTANLEGMLMSPRVNLK